MNTASSLPLTIAEPGIATYDAADLAELTVFTRTS